MLAGTLKGIISQRLVPRADGNGRVAIAEIMTMTVHDMIIDPAKTAKLTDVIEDGGNYGMQDALRTATRPHDLKLLVGAEGHLHTTMEDITQPAAGPVA